MSEQELKNKLALDFADGVVVNGNIYRSDRYDGFLAGWDAAGENLVRDEKRMWDENEELRKERDALLVEIERLNKYTVNGYSILLNESKASAEKLATALEWYAKATCAERGADGALAVKVLAEYRAKFPKTNEIRK